ncbi:Big_5 domain-containing protein [Pseudomonas sp. IT-347P]|uniref:hypothetical protein n=1 Tax=Pseudomonas sp. IT-347P TaxID=3026458 RepID=UPI0039E032B4
MTDDRQDIEQTDDMVIRIKQPSPQQLLYRRRVGVDGLVNGMLMGTVITVRRINDDGRDQLLGLGTTIPIPFPDPDYPDGMKVVSWSMVPVYMNFGTNRIYARVLEGQSNSVDSRIIEFTVAPLGIPVIDFPEAGVTYASRLSVKGSIPRNSVRGDWVKVYFDQRDDLIGQVSPADDYSWALDPVNFEPGVRSIVALTSSLDDSGDRSRAISFRVRPPTLAIPDVTFPAVRTARFSGTGHYDPLLETQVQFVVKSGPGTAPPNAVVKDNGSWETTAADWSFGTYSVEVIQKIADNASGWIESQCCSFEVKYEMPDVFDLSADENYQPNFFGKGHTGATVQLYHPGGFEPPAAPPVVVRDGIWSSRASEVWGPSCNREVHIRQVLGDHLPNNWVKLPVTIPPLAPGLDTIPVSDTRPVFGGTCWPGAEVTVAFSDDPETFKADVATDKWTFQREKEFAGDLEHTVTVTQKAAGQTSEATSRTFTIELPVRQPLILFPELDDAEVGSDVVIRGTGAIKGATLQLRDAQFQVDLGPEITLNKDGHWAASLDGLAFRRYSIDAQQKLRGRFSERSPLRHFEVVLLPPHINHPTPGGRVTRAARLQGVGKIGGHVTVFLDGLAEPLVRDIPVVSDSWWSSRWEVDVALPTGPQILWALQTFMDAGRLLESGDSEPLSFDVVPLMPAIETPAPGASIGRRAVVSGFGVAGDTINVTLGSVTQTAVVSSDGTWSVAVQHDLPDGDGVLQVTAQCMGLKSDVVERALVVGVYQPVIEEPAPGRWVSDPVSFAGQGRDGEGQVVSWYDPQVKWTAPLAVTGQGWRGASAVPLPVGGNWCRFRQTLSGGTSQLSDWVQSARFEVGGGSDGKR